MARLYRPHIPLKVRYQVILRQVGAFDPTAMVRSVEKREEYYELRPGAPPTLRRKTFRNQLDFELQQFAWSIGCQVSDLRLDHDPPLAARPQERRGLGRKTYYVPDANDPEHLFYRPHGPQFEGSHLIKTNVRGDHGQHPDRVLIKKMRRIERGPRPKRQPGFKKNPKAPKRKWPSRPFPTSKGRT